MYNINILKVIKFNFNQYVKRAQIGQNIRNDNIVYYYYYY